MTAAHRTRPMGSYVMVTNLANGVPYASASMIAGPHVEQAKLLISATEHRA